MNPPGKFIGAAAGWVVDAYRLVTCRLENPHSYLKYLMIRRVRRSTGSTTFIESGTYLGGTTYRCSKEFEKVYTIELDAQLAAKARANLAACRNVEVIQGDATVEMERVLMTRPVERATVFLDGHYSGGDTSSGAFAEPAIQELEVLGRHRHRINAVIIDDFRNFGVEPGHPPKSTLLAAIETHFPETEFTTRIQNDQVIVMRKQ